jgi:hypothetical protein
MLAHISPVHWSIMWAKALDWRALPAGYGMSSVVPTLAAAQHHQIHCASRKRQRSALHTANGSARESLDPGPHPDASDAGMALDAANPAGLTRNKLEADLHEPGLG